jgi:UDP-N-acetylglucosamine--N-acetylmuramyl-(pentapeptide) pyrophosphoryl-undecaprenol N-acetylglucosamine transferase
LVDIVFTGGGTAGHVTPNLALFSNLKAANYQLAYIGQANSIEQDLVSKEEIPFFSIPAGKLRRYFDFKNFTDIFKIGFGLLAALWHLLRLRPKLVFSKGGFVSCPVVWAAWLLRIPVVIHESDISPGLANKLSIPFAKKICFSFPETEKYLPKNKRVLTGLPIRDFLKQGKAEKAQTLCQFEEEKPVIVIIGGSQGSQTLNKLVRENLNKLGEHYNVVHLCGAGGLDESLFSTQGYRQFEYLNEELPDVFALANLVISRAGATSIFELLSIAKPNLLIPLPLGASRGDQILNAASFEKQGFSQVVEEQALNDEPELFMQKINSCFEKAETMRSSMALSSKEDAKIAILNLIQANLKS